MSTAIERLVATRRSLHAVAEHVLSPWLHVRNGRIGLRPTLGGFSTPEVVSGRACGGDSTDGVVQQVRVESLDLVVRTGTSSRSQTLSTVGAAAALVGITPGAPTSVFTPSTPLDPDEPLHIEADAAHVFADWFALGADVLAAAAPGETAQLWPEHFDLAVAVTEVNLGFSPGDDAHPLPYAYVGPWAAASIDAAREQTPELWNEPWGASLDWRADLGADEVAAFFRAGLVLAPRA